MHRDWDHPSTDIGPDEKKGEQQICLLLFL
ncbi:hypothetical protein VTH82DRAFT_2022 [Thermothelomyces myriococcoides]